MHNIVWPCSSSNIESIYLQLSSAGSNDDPGVVIHDPQVEAGSVRGFRRGIVNRSQMAIASRASGFSCRYAATRSRGGKILERLLGDKLCAR